MKNRIEDLRDHLFATIDGLLDKDRPMDLDRAKAIADVAQVIINSAKVEVDYLRATDSLGTGFLEKQSVQLVGHQGGKSKWPA